MWETQELLMMNLSHFHRVETNMKTLVYKTDTFYYAQPGKYNPIAYKARVYM